MPAHYLFVLLSLSLAATANQENTVVFKSIDSAGRVSYGDAPSADAIDFELIEIKPTAETNDSELDKRLDRMAATTKRLQEDRKQRELEQEQEHKQKDTIVYYPAANPGYSHYRRNSGHHYGKHRDRPYYSPDYVYQKPGYQYDSHSSNYHRRGLSSNLTLGYKGSHFGGSLHLGSRQIERRRSLPYSPLLKHPQP